MNWFCDVHIHHLHLAPLSFSLFFRIWCMSCGCNSDFSVPFCRCLVTFYCSLVLCHSYLFLLSWHSFLRSLFPFFLALLARHSVQCVTAMDILRHDWAKTQWPLAFEPGGLQGCVLLGLIFLDWLLGISSYPGNLVSDCATVTACTYSALITYIYWCLPTACIRFLCETSPCMCTWIHSLSVHVDSL